MPESDLQALLRRSAPCLNVCEHCTHTCRADDRSSWVAPEREQPSPGCPLLPVARAASVALQHVELTFTKYSRGYFHDGAMAGDSIRMFRSSLPRRFTSVHDRDEPLTLFRPVPLIAFIKHSSPLAMWMELILVSLSHEVAEISSQFAGRN